MSIVTCTAKTRNDLSVARIVIEVLAQSWGYKCSVTYNEGKSFDVMVPAGVEDNAIQKFKRLAPDLDIYKSDKKAMATAQTESRRRMKKESSIDDFTSLSFSELPNDIKEYLTDWIGLPIEEWEDSDEESRYDWIVDGIEQGRIYSAEFPRKGESRKLKRKSESRRRMKKERRTYFDSEVVKMSYGELPDDVQQFIGDSSDWDNASEDTRYEWIADGIERNRIYSVEFDTMNDHWN